MIQTRLTGVICCVHEKYFLDLPILLDDRCVGKIIEAQSSNREIILTLDVNAMLSIEYQMVKNTQ